MTNAPSSGNQQTSDSPQAARDASGAINWDQVRSRLAAIGVDGEQERQLSARDEKALLRERARLLAMPPADEAKGTHVFLNVKLGSRMFAVPAAEVGAVVVGAEVAALPGATGMLYALAAWRSRLLRVLDIRPSLGLDAASSKSLLVIGNQESDLALVVDSVEHTSLLDDSALQPVPFDTAAPGMLAGILADGTPVLNLQAAVQHSALATREA